VTTWTFIWLILILKIPIVALFLIVRWAVRQTPETEPGHDGGIGPRPLPIHAAARPARPALTDASRARTHRCLAPAPATPLTPRFRGKRRVFGHGRS
jgi:hypothetical protein